MHKCVTCGEEVEKSRSCDHIMGMSPWCCHSGNHEGCGKPKWHAGIRVTDYECPGYMLINGNRTECHCDCHVQVTDEQVTDAVSSLLALAAATKPKEPHALRSANVGGQSQ